MMPLETMFDVLAVLRVEAVGVLILFQDLADDDRAVLARVDARSGGPEPESALRTISTPVFWSSFCVRIFFERLAGAQQRDAAARQDAFLDRRAGRVHRIVDAVLALLHLDLGRAADADHRDAARELGETLLQLLAVVVRGGLLDLRLDLRDAAPRCRPSCRRR